MADLFRGSVPEVGARVRHYHPWLEDHADGTVTRLEWLPEQFQRGPFTFQRCRVYLTDCLHWRADHTWGPVEDTYFDNMAEAWEYVTDAQPGLETVLPAEGAAPGPGEGA